MKKIISIYHKLDIINMPFVMLCGLPSSGKTFYCSKLVEYFKGLDKKVNVINDSMYCTDKNSVFLGKKM